jgi:hypothetical protein
VEARLILAAQGMAAGLPEAPKRPA